MYYAHLYWKLLSPQTSDAFEQRGRETSETETDGKDKQKQILTEKLHELIDYTCLDTTLRLGHCQPSNT